MNFDAFTNADITFKVTLEIAGTFLFGFGDNIYLSLFTSVASIVIPIVDFDIKVWF